MPNTELGHFIRERRQDLNLTQEELAERLGGSASQAEVSRLERGMIALPRRARLDALAVALEVTLGSLLLQSGWLTSAEQVQVDGPLEGPVPPDPLLNDAMLAEVAILQTTLRGILERVEALQATLQPVTGSVHRPTVNLPADVCDDWETSAVFTA